MEDLLRGQPGRQILTRHFFLWGWMKNLVFEIQMKTFLTFF